MLLITGAGALAYMDAPSNGATNFDDPWQVTENKLVQDACAGNVARILTRPCHGTYLPAKLLSYMADYAVYRALGVDPVKGIHLTNVALHVANSLLVALLCGLAVRDLAPQRLTFEGAAFVGVFSGILFVLHPVHVESVAWLSSRKDVLSFFFMALSFLCLRNVFLRRSLIWAFSSVVLFIFAAASKSTVLSLPLLGITYWFLVGRRGGGRAISVIGLLAVTAVVAAMVAAAAAAGEGYRARPVGGSFVTHYLTLLKTFPFYMRKLMFPVNLCVIYAVPPALGFGDPGVWWGAALLLGQIAVAVFVRVRTARFIVLWYLIALLPVIQIIPVPVSALAADRYAYIASVPFALAPALIAWNVRTALIRRGALALSTVLVAACLLYAGALGAATWSRNRVWRSSEALWRDCLAKNPSSRTALVNLAAVHLERGDLSAARALYEDAIRIDPGFILAHYHLGEIFEKTGAPYLARALYSRALAAESSLAERQTRRYKGLSAVRLADMALEEGKYESALTHARRAMEFLVSPARAEAMLKAASLGRDALGEDTPDGDVIKKALILTYRALESLNEARRLADLLIKAGDAAAGEGDPQTAERHYRSAAEALEDYAEPHLRLARLFNDYGRWKPAYDEFTAAFIRGAAGARFEHDYGLAAIGLGRYREAAERLSRAVKLEPSLTEAKVKLAYARAHLGEFDAALALVEEVMADEPDNENARRVKRMILEMRAANADAGHGR